MDSKSKERKIIDGVIAKIIPKRIIKLFVDRSFIVVKIPGIIGINKIIETYLVCMAKSPKQIEINNKCISLREFHSKYLSHDAVKNAIAKISDIPMLNALIKKGLQNKYKKA